MSSFQDVYSVLSAHKLNFEQTPRNGKCHFETFVMFEGGNRQEIHGRKIPKLLSVFFSFLSTLSVKTNRLKAFLLLHTFSGAIILSPKFAILNQLGGGRGNGGSLNPILKTFMKCFAKNDMLNVQHKHQLLCCCLDFRDWVTLSYLKKYFDFNKYSFNWQC